MRRRTSSSVGQGPSDTASHYPIVPEPDPDVLGPSYVARASAVSKNGLSDLGSTSRNDGLRRDYYNSDGVKLEILQIDFKDYGVDRYLQRTDDGWRCIYHNVSQTGMNCSVSTKKKNHLKKHVETVHMDIE